MKLKLNSVWSQYLQLMAKHASTLSHKKVVLTNRSTCYLLMIICCSFNHLSASGFTELQATLGEACVGEDVTLSCATSTYYTRWQVSLSGSTDQPVVRTFQRSDSIRMSYRVSTSELQLHFELIINSMGVLNSTLLVQTTAALDRASIECQATTTENYTFRIARAPTRPRNVTVSQKMFNHTAVQFTLFWNSPTTGRVDMYHVNVSYGLTQSVEYVTTTPSVEVEGIDYDRQVIISITSINCHSESESAFYNLTFGRCNKTAPQNGMLINDSSSDSHAIPGEEILFTCNPGFSPRVIKTTVCQENGTWTLDPNRLLCLIECHLPLLTDNHLEIVEESLKFNGTVTLGSELHFRCEQGFVGEDLRPAVCSSNGVWIPDPHEYECHQNQIELDVNVTQRSDCNNCRLEHGDQTPIKIIAGSVTAVGICCGGTAFLVFIVCLIRSKRANASRLETGCRGTEERVYDICLGEPEEPTYDIIHPTYEVISPEIETKLTFTVNDAYNLKGGCD